jgi:nitrogen regulatory protein PII
MATDQVCKVHQSVVPNLHAHTFFEGLIFIVNLTKQMFIMSHIHG